MINGFLRQTFFNNTVLDYLISVAIFVIGSLIIWLFKRIYLPRLKVRVENTETGVDDFILKMIESRILPLAYFGVFYICMYGLNLRPIFSKGLNITGLLLLVVFGVRIILSIFEYSVNNYLIQKKDLDLSKQQAIKVVVNMTKLIAWSLAVIIIFDNFGIKISALMTGLGIGGVAVALASQTVLGDMFNYFTIFFDRPFALGDFIIIDEYRGTVEHIGIKTTRLRSLSGEQLIFSNSDLTNSRVRNYKRMEQRRISFQFRVSYDTPIEMLEEIPVIVRKIIEKFDATIFDRAHFFQLGEFALIFEVVYYVLSSDYKRYMDIQQEINLMIMREFKARNIKFAYSTQRLFVNQPVKE
ncbi:MAG: mechanosensitive ion channel family protein [Firmicutes bacterium]|nr:mechanosensitive ion channel family protein [Bacillota bacterium]